MNKPTIHRHTPNSRTGRSMISPGKAYDPSAISPEVREWNAKVEQTKREKLQRKLSKTPNQPRDPVHYHEGKWWFWDETWAGAEGPYDSEAQARDGMDAYCKMLDGPIIDCNESCPIP